MYEAIKRAPWLFACALPMSAPSDGGITSTNLTSKLASVPLWIFQGALDTAPTPAHYYWYRNGSKLSLADTVKSPVITSGSCSTGPCANNGTYTLVVANYDNCPTPASPGRGVYFNDQAPVNITTPTNFTGSAASSSSIKLNWSDVSSGEIGFEIWRRKVTGSGTYST